jgi:hypothetical protein
VAHTICKLAGCRRCASRTPSLGACRHAAQRVVIDGRPARPRLGSRDILHRHVGKRWVPRPVASSLSELRAVRTVILHACGPTRKRLAVPCLAQLRHLELQAGCAVAQQVAHLLALEELAMEVCEWDWHCP